MKIYNNTRSTIRPQARKIDEYSVWVASNITEIHEEEFDGYEYTLTQYSKDEYISNLDEQIVNLELALCDVYELIGG